MNAKQRESIRILRSAIKPFIEIDGAMSVNRLEALLAVLSEGFTDMLDVREYFEREHGLSKSALSRMISWWGDEAYLQFKTDEDGNQVIPDRPEGQGFLKFTPDPRDYRRRNVTVTPEGEQFGQAIADNLAVQFEEHAERWQAK